MNQDNKMNKDLAGMIAETGTLPPSEADKLKSLAQTRQEVSKLMSNMQESIDFLRLGIKYVMFDLEATRRENAGLRKMLELQGE